MQKRSRYLLSWGGMGEEFIGWVGGGNADIDDSREILNSDCTISARSLAVAPPRPAPGPRGRGTSIHYSNPGSEAEAGAGAGAGAGSSNIIRQQRDRDMRVIDVTVSE